MSQHDVDYIYDDPEIIKLCLNCDKRECTNCLGDNVIAKPRNTAAIDHDVFMDMYNKRYTDAQIAQKLGVSPSYVHYYRKKHDIPSKRAKNGIDEEMLIELYEQGMNDSEIAEIMDMSTAYICRYRNKLGLPTKHKTKRRK